MFINMQAALAEEVADGKADAHARGQWVETTLTVLFAAAAMLFVSFLAVVTGLV